MTKAEWLQRYLVKNGLNNARASFLTSVYAKLLNPKTETSRCPAQITEATPRPLPNWGGPHFSSMRKVSHTARRVIFIKKQTRH